MKFDCGYYYCIDTVQFCMPCEAPEYLYMRTRKNPHLNLSSYYGILAPYIGRKMTMAECDDLICQLIKGHPFMENAMDIEVNFVKTNDSSTEYYHCLRFDNPNYPDGVDLPLKSAILYAF